jgi:hypothetical protein
MRVVLTSRLPKSDGKKIRTEVLKEGNIQLMYVGNDGRNLNRSDTFGKRSVVGQQRSHTHVPWTVTLPSA